MHNFPIWYSMNNNELKLDFLSEIFLIIGFKEINNKTSLSNLPP